MAKVEGNFCVRRRHLMAASGGSEGTGSMAADDRGRGDYLWQEESSSLSSVDVCCELGGKWMRDRRLRERILSAERTLERLLGAERTIVDRSV
jgi:hypothetical protein